MIATRWFPLAACALFLAGCVGCRFESETKPGDAPKDGPAAGTTTPAGQTAPITIEGSSTVYPISQAVAEAFRESHPGIDITVGYQGTGSGFKNLALGTIEICDASRPIMDLEKEACAKAGVEYLELQIAVDALTVAVHPANDWSPCMSVAQLKKLWEPGSKVSKWSELDPSWPDHKIELYGAGTESGTFDYFTEAIVGKAKQSRTDYTGNENDNFLVQGVADEKYALGYFGYGYYAENTDRVKAVSIKANDDAECVAPSPETVDNGTYTPLTRPLFIYVNKKALQRKEVAEYLQFYLSDAGQKMVTERKFLLMKPDVLTEMQARLTDALK
ncbi:MAG TPA: PstS family phosphate ABC transporter substrate-binding protein [Planctomycetaceae bacterium]|nr:PstS family phosphate ABC transporter substrate-binding protein [Planctomycetaceae bacterium]